MNLYKQIVHRHFKIYKPYGYLSQFESNAKHQKNSKFLGCFHDFPKDIMSIGRLDQDSEGLLLLTTHGQVSNEINSRSYEKEYYAQLDGIITDDAIDRMRQGLEIGNEGLMYRTEPCQISRLEAEPFIPPRGKTIRHERHGPTSWVSITVTEGKFRQVRKMTSAVGYPTLRLVRMRIGHHHLNRMQPGDVIELNTLV